MKTTRLTTGVAKVLFISAVFVMERITHCDSFALECHVARLVLPAFIFEEKAGGADSSQGFQMMFNFQACLK
jgi:hypothetical protein